MRAGRVHSMMVVPVTARGGPRVRHPRTTDEGGRGLLLVARLGDRWGTRRTGRGKTIWTEQRLPASGAP